MANFRQKSSSNAGHVIHYVEEGKPPNGQLIAWSTDNAFPQTQRDGNK